MSHLSNFFALSLRENVSASAGFLSRGISHCMNFSEDYICFGRDCIVILSRDQSGFELKNEKKQYSIAQYVMYVALTILLVPPAICLVLKIIHRVVVKSQGLDLSAHLLKPNPVAEPAPVVKPNPIVEPAPVVEPKPIVIPVPFVDVESIVDPIPVVEPISFPKVVITDKPLSRLSGKSDTIDQPKPIVSDLTTQPLSYGPNAFISLELAEGDQSYPSFTDKQIDQIFDGYGQLFNAQHPRIPGNGGIVRNLIKKTYSNGLPNYPYAQSEIQIYLKLILDAISKESPLSSIKKKSLAERLADAFKECQVIQFQTMQNMGKELLCKGNIVESICLYWQHYKMQKLEEVVGDRHPGSQSVSDARPTEQFDHIKNTYIVLLGESYGLEVKTAKDDKCRPKEVLKWGESLKTLREDYDKRLNLEEFIKEVALDINNPNQECSRIDKALVFQWGKNNAQPTFGFYDEESKDYSGLGKASEDQEVMKAPFVSLSEVRFLLKSVGISN